MVDILLKYRRIQETKLDANRLDFVCGESKGYSLFPDDEWYSVSELWEFQKAWQKTQPYPIGYGELMRSVEYMWLVGWLERNNYA
jgi:hypothetical protein